jgi:hypothetical protein
MSKAPDSVWIASLIDSGAADLAIEVCEFRLDRCVPGSNAHAQWAMLLLEATTAQSLESIEWNALIDPLESMIDELAKLPGSKQAAAGPRAPWVRWKEIWCRRLIQQRTLAAYLAVPGRKTYQDWLLQSIRLGLDDLDSLEQIVLKMQPDKPILSKAQRELKDKTQPNEITASEILDLRGEIELLRADLLYQRSICHPSGSDEQIAAATQMLSSIDRASGQLPSTWTHRPMLVLARAEAELQLGRHAAVQKSMSELWESLEVSSNPEAKDWKLAAASLAIRSARISEQWVIAEAWLARAGGWERSPELALEHVAIQIKRELGRSASPESILKLRGDISKRFGKYWEQRVDAMLVSNPAIKLPEASTTPGNHRTNPETSPSMASLELFRIQARQAIAAKQFEIAIEKLQQAESAASKLGSAQGAFQFAMQIAALLEKTGQQAAAADEFYRAAISYPESPQASSAGLMSAWLIRNPDSKLDADAQQVRQSMYLQRLKETATLWPQSASATQAIDLLESKWLTAGDYVSCLDFWKEYLTKEPSVAKRASKRLLLVKLVSQEDWLERPVQDASALAKSSQELQDTLSKSDDASNWSAWIRSIGSTRRWSKDVVPMPSADQADLIGLVADGWNSCEHAWQTGQLKPPMLEDLEQLQKSLADRSAGLKSFADGRLSRFIDLLRIELGASTAEELKQELEKRISKEPKSLWWVYRSARTMQRSTSLGEAAMGWYRQMAAGVPPGSEPWLEARARTIEVLRGRGEVAKARQLCDLVRAAYPDLSGDWRSRFEDR